MPGRRNNANGGPWGVYTLGVFSGVASSCCAPVLAGVIALSGLASSFGVALGLGTAYVFARLSGDFPITLTVVALDSEEGTALARTGGVLFPPGLFVDGDPAGYGRISERRLRRQLRQRVASC